MCFSKRRQKSKQCKQLFQKLVQDKQKLLKKKTYSRHFMEMLTFMQDVLKRQVSSFVTSIFATINLPKSYVRQRFQKAFLQCSLWMIQTATQPNYEEDILNINQTIDISVQQFFSQQHQNYSKIVGYKLFTDIHQIDLRRYLVRSSKTRNNNYILQSIYQIKPEKLRISFQKDSKDVQVFLNVAKKGFLYEAEFWSKGSELVHINNKVNVKRKQKKIDFGSDQVQKDIWFQLIQSLNKKKSIKKQQKKFIFAEQSQEQEQKLKMTLNLIKIQKQKKDMKLKQQQKLKKKKKLNKPNATIYTQNLPDHIKRLPNALQLQPMKRNQRNIIKQICPGYCVRDIGNLSQFVTVTNKDVLDRIKIFYNVKDNQIKAQIRFQKNQPRLVVLGILDYTNYQKWNGLIESTELLMKIQSQNSNICQFKVKGIPKSIICIVHLCEFQNNYIIVYKPIALQALFDHIIYRVNLNKGKVQILVHICYSKNQDFALEYIKSLQKLDDLLQSYAAKQSLKQHLKFGRLIDKDVHFNLEEHERRSHQYSFGSSQFGNIQQMQSKQISSPVKVQVQQSSLHFHSITSFSQFNQK